VTLTVIPVVLKDGHEKIVSKDQLQYLMYAKKVLFFKRSEGWVVPGRDSLRTDSDAYAGAERRQHSVYSVEY
jgi:hypothetical protein